MAVTVQLAASHLLARQCSDDSHAACEQAFRESVRHTPAAPMNKTDMHIVFAQLPIRFLSDIFASTRTRIEKVCR